MSANSYIPDGFTASAYIAEYPGLYSACRFKFRPMLHAERSKVFDAGRIDNFNSAKATYLALEKHVVEWDVRSIDAKGEPGEVLPIKALCIARLAPNLIERLFAIVAGVSAADEDPAIARTEPLDQFDVLLEGQSHNDTKREAELKN
jgi:hypothetical protein